MASIQLPNQRLSPHLEHRAYGLRNARQLRFCKLFISEAEGKPGLAAKLAGYPHPRVHGSKLLATSSVQAAIAQLINEHAAPPVEVQFWINQIARIDLSDCYVEDDNGEPILSYAKLKAKGKLGLIEQVVPTKYGKSYKPYAKLAALKMLAQIHGMLKDVHEVEHTDKAAETRATLEAKLSALRPAMDAKLQEIRAERESAEHNPGGANRGNTPPALPRPE